MKHFESLSLNKGEPSHPISPGPCSLKKNINREEEFRAWGIADQKRGKRARVRKTTEWKREKGNSQQNTISSH